MSETIKKITVTLQTATQERGERTFKRRVGVEGDSKVYLGIAGREFSCRLAGNKVPFQPGDSNTFVFGGDPNVLDAPINDPQNIPLAEVKPHPVYIRFEPHPYDDDNWCLERAEVVVEASGKPLRLHAVALDGEATIWLGRESGHTVHLA
ncbi:hypothetical protein [Streptomyces antimicrobicus]|uniref:Uncharacterized protein n=1 Tax=Streptomyces antimicrobicus TaxID=2883108 RepID=A0ABS8B011_9ACTN|nr:hypothetical protein [Streptomyces antimicrobicus]MCB5177941.1 hypothetical protein [Streptomyces antimicrobicus]